ncbi:RNA polymerase sigma factor [Labilibaculum manganireducens]|uniref:RNA polymerase sigma-70 factor n=1 Tax=Labilibaculum manganireducens TaxID=1940525 RepID=A0A2N3I2Y6_9BACT|nr:RNA polymerase sigma-70 factor [Labilibaculum manganireducens]PKQ64675.1 hypothetical protein BZG01_14170 [Labilibaculum manganireducens]
MKTFDQTFLKLFRNGNQDSFKILYDKYFDALFLFGHKYVLAQDVVEDIIQESFIKIWEKRSSFYHEGAIRAFLYKTVRNSCLNQIEHQKVRKSYEGQSDKNICDEDYFLHNVIEEEVSRIIKETVHKLPESARLIYLLSLKGLKNAEIAEDLDISINTVKTQKQRASKFLKENLKNLFSILYFI